MNDPTSIAVRLGQTHEIIDLRWRILRAGLPMESAYFDGDDEPTTRHFVAVRNGKVIGCATILRRDWQGEPAWQLRGMAIEPELQRSGVGRLLLQHVEQLVRSESHSLQLWCNARTPAMPFYQRLGWRIEGTEFVIPSAGPHFKMSKMLLYVAP